MIRWIALAAALAVAGCSSAAPREGSPTPRSSSTLITAAEIQEEGLGDLDGYELVERLRPRWLIPKPGQTPSDPPQLIPVVYVDNVRQGDPTMLRNVPAGDVLDLRLLNERDANFRYGVGHRGGAIVVRTKRSQSGGGL